MPTETRIIPRIRVEAKRIPMRLALELQVHEVERDEDRLDDRQGTMPPARTSSEWCGMIAQPISTIVSPSSHQKMAM